MNKELKNIKTFESFVPSADPHVDEFLGGIKDKLAGIQKIVLDKVKPSDDAKEFVRRDVSTYKSALTKLNIPMDLLKNAIMAMYDYADGVPLLDRMELKYEPSTKTLTVQNKNKGSMFAGDPVRG